MTDNCAPVATCTPGSSFAVDEVAATAGDDVAATAGDGVAATVGDDVTATAGDTVASDAWPRWLRLLALRDRKSVLPTTAPTTVSALVRDKIDN